MFVWNCNTKYIYGQSSSTSIDCSPYQWYTITIDVTATGVTFTDSGGQDHGTTISVDHDTLGASPVYVNVGADCDWSCSESTGAQWDWIHINPEETTCYGGTTGLWPDHQSTDGYAYCGDGSTGYDSLISGLPAGQVPSVYCQGMSRLIDAMRTDDGACLATCDAISNCNIVATILSGYGCPADNPYCQVECYGFESCSGSSIPTYVAN